MPIRTRCSPTSPSRGRSERRGESVDQIPMANPETGLRSQAITSPRSPVSSAMPIAIRKTRSPGASAGRGGGPRWWRPEPSVPRALRLLS
jgi:hypothetical protein